jgi:hypothetical protein
MMKLDQPNHDDAIEKTLAVLQRAAPPEGMEERILQRLHQHTSVAPTAQFFWRDLLAGSALTSAWWRGAVSGAATAALLVGALLLPQHGLRTRSGHTPQPAISQVTATPNLAPAVVTVTASASANNSHTTPCATPGLLRTARVVPVYRAESIASASFAPSRPAPILPLTAEERALVRLAQTADPKLLATLAPEAQAKNVAQEANDFDKFFAPPPAPPQPPDGESPTNTQEIRTAPQQGEQI